MALGDVIARLSVVLGMETAAFEKGATIAEKRLKQSQRTFEKLGRKMGDLGTKLSVGVTAPMALIAKEAVAGFVEQEKAMADVEAALRSMGDVSGKTAGELSKTADALEMKSLFDAEVILKDVTANLLTFGNVAGEQFDRAQQAAVDMAARLGTGPKEAAIQLGKALNDPVKGLSSLSRVGIQFTEDQTAVIKSLAETGRVAEAQGIILSELEKQFGGAAAAAADATPWRQAQVAIGQAMDVIGGAILPIIKPAAEAIASIARAFASLPEPAQKALVVIAAIGAALGPILLVLGPIVSAMAPFLASLKAIAAAQGVFVALGAGATGLLATLGPIALAVGAVYLAWKNWDEIAPRLQPLIDQLTALGEGLGLVEMKAGATKDELAKDEGWRSFGRTVADVGQRIADFIDQSGAAGVAVNRWAKDMIASLGRMASAGVAAVQRMVSEIGTAITGRLSAVWDAAKAKIEQVRAAFFNLWDKVTRRSYVPDMVDDIAAEMKRLDTVMVAQAQKATGAAGQAFRDMASAVSGLLDRLFPEAAQLRGYREDVALLGQATAQLGLPADQAAEAYARLRRELAGLSAEGGFAKPVAFDNDNGLQAANQQAQLEALSNAISAKLGLLKEKASEFGQVASFAFESFTYQLEGFLLGAQSAGDAIRNLVRELASMALQQFVFAPLKASLGIPGFATGTNSAPRGMALVGERGPELVDFRGGERVYTNSETRGMIAGGGAPVFHINVGGGMSNSAARRTGMQIGSAAMREFAMARRTGLAG